MGLGLESRFDKNADSDSSPEKREKKGLSALGETTSKEGQTCVEGGKVGVGERLLLLLLSNLEDECQQEEKAPHE